MSIRFETIKDLDRENKAADFLCNMFGFNKKKLSENDIDFAIYDGIIFSRTEKLKGNIKVGGRKPRKGSSNDIEFMAYYNKQINLKEIKYEIR